MIVRMRTTAAGPDGVLLAGRIYDLPKDRGQKLADTGCAEIVKGKEAKKEPIIETANLEPAKQTTTKSGPKRSGRKRADTPESWRR